MNAIYTAAELLKERAKRTTDETAFTVELDQDSERIYLHADTDRRSSGYNNKATFYHAEAVTAICEALRLSFYISCSIEYAKNGRPEPCFEVVIS